MYVERRENPMSTTNLSHELNLFRAVFPDKVNICSFYVRVNLQSKTIFQSSCVCKDKAVLFSRLVKNNLKITAKDTRHTLYSVH